MCFLIRNIKLINCDKRHRLESLLSDVSKIFFKGSLETCFGRFSKSVDSPGDQLQLTFDLDGQSFRAVLDEIRLEFSDGDVWLKQPAAAASRAPRKRKAVESKAIWVGRGASRVGKETCE